MKYDRAVCDVLQKQVKAKASFKGIAMMFGHSTQGEWLSIECDRTTLNQKCRDCTLKMEAGETVTVAKLKIIACKSPQADAADAIKKTPAKDKDKDKDS
ncbi:hypothetical protein FRC17_006175 [Serendipita sp. 399]|nr:hypothetical protein FRC17_006175 [Serendipita sp. 399]